MNKFRSLVKGIAKSAVKFLDEKSSFRQIYFDMQPPDSLLVARTVHGNFIVNSSDKAIGLSCYVQRGAYDFDRFASAIKMLPNAARISILVDVGANIGTISIPALKSGLFKRAIAVEPEPRNFKLLRINVILNGLEGRFVLHNVAAGGGADETIVFELSEDNYGDHRVRGDVGEGLFSESKRSTIAVRSMPLHELLEGEDPGEILLWIDTQGYEGAVLSGAQKLIEKRVPLCFEFWPYGLHRLGGFELLKSALSGAEYSFIIDLDDPEKKVAFSISELDAAWARVGTSGAYTDLLLF